MSRSNDTDIHNPAVKFFQWSGSTGQIKYYDRETKENVFIDLPFTFLVLDKLVTITGFDDAEQSGFWSNEIRNTKRETLTVRTKAGVRKEGYYDEIKGLTGVKFAQSVYLAFRDEENNLQIGNFKFAGCAVSAWIEFCKGKNLYKNAIQITDKQQGKKGATVFFSPVFQVKEDVSPTTQNAAIELDKELQDYLTAYLAMRGASDEDERAENTESYIDRRNREFEPYENEPEFPPRNDADLIPPDDEEEIPF